MKLAKPTPCRSCEKPVAICAVRGGTWMPFELELIPAATDAVDAYLPLRHGHLVVFTPIGEVAPRHIDSVRWYAQRHRCAPYLRQQAIGYQVVLARRENVASLGDSLESVLGPLLDADDHARLASGETA